MNESQLISELCAALDEEAGALRAPAGVAERALRRTRKRRLAAAVPAVAVVLGVGMVVAVSGPQAPVGRSASRTGGGTHAVCLTAFQVLDRAAAAALAEPTVVPGPDQFVYWKDVGSDTGTTETWRSVDGSRNGFVLSDGKGPERAKKVMLWGCSHGSQTVKPDRGSGHKPITQPCIGQAAYLPDMPTTASAMGHYLDKNFGAAKYNAAVAQKITEGVLEENYLLPAQRAALYRFFVTTPGLKVVPSVHDYIGRPGIGVSWTGGGMTITWIFAQKTFAFLGTTTTEGKLVSANAVVKVAIVNEAGQRS